MTTIEQMKRDLYRIRIMAQKDDVCILPKYKPGLYVLLDSTIEILRQIDYSPKHPEVTLRALKGGAA